jgi:hypothetical protein
MQWLPRRLVHSAIERREDGLDVLLVSIMHQRQAYHAILGIHTQIAHQAVRVKNSVLGAGTLVL